jgi:hypothetical protein
VQAHLAGCPTCQALASQARGRLSPTPLAGPLAAPSQRSLLTAGHIAGLAVTSVLLLLANTPAMDVLAKANSDALTIQTTAPPAPTPAPEADAPVVVPPAPLAPPEPAAEPSAAATAAVPAAEAAAAPGGVRVAASAGRQAGTQPTDQPEAKPAPVSQLLAE